MAYLDNIVSRRWITLRDVCVCVLCVLRVCAHMVGFRVQSVGECGCRVEGGGHGIVLTG